MIKYRIPYKGYDESEWVIAIDVPSYAGMPIDVKAVEGNACILSYDGGVDDPLDNPIINTTADIQLYNEGQIDVQELQLSKDRTVVVTVSRNGAIKFRGYMISDGIQREFTAPPYTLRLSATSGLNLLEGMTFSRDETETNNSPLVYLMRILQDSNNLGVNLPIRWATTVRALDASINGDPMTSLSWSADGEGYSYYDVEKGKYVYQNCFFIIEGLVKALQCRIFQADGFWWVLDIRKSIGDSVSYSQCLDRASFPAVTTGSISVNKHIGNELKFKNEDAVLTTKPAIDKVNVRYTQSQNENILPNGGFDIWKGTELIHWSSSHSSLAVTKHNQINARGGWAVSLINNGTEEHAFRLTNPLPIDAHNLFKRISWGFNMMPKGGYPLTENQVIDWRLNEVKCSVKYTTNEGGVPKEYYLNEFGYWSDKNLSPNQEVTYFGFNPAYNWFTISFDENRSFFVGDAVFIRFFRNGVYEEYTTVFTEHMDSARGTNYIAGLIPNHSRPAVSTIQVNNARYGANQDAYAYKVDNYYKYLYFSVDNMRLNDVASVKFTGPGNLDVKIIDPGAIDLSTPAGVGLLSIEFFLRPARVVSGKSLPAEYLVLDDVWFSVDDNNDIYTAAINDSTVNAEDITLNVSSSFSGFFVSNLMRSYHQSNIDWKFTDGQSNGSLTELYARMVMGFRHNPLKIFNGTVSTRGIDWSYINNYNVSQLGDDRFININPRYNTERNEINLIAIELKYVVPENLVVGHNISDISALVNKVVSGGGIETDRPLQDLQITTEQGNTTTLDIITKGTRNIDFLEVPGKAPVSGDMLPSRWYMYVDVDAPSGSDPEPGTDFYIKQAKDANLANIADGQVIAWSVAQGKFVPASFPSLSGYATQSWVLSQDYASKSWVQGQGYLTQEVDTLQSVASRGNTFNGSIRLTKDDSDFIVGNNGDIGLIKKGGFAGFYAVGRDTPFSVRRSLTAVSDIRYSDTFEELMYIGSDGSLILPKQGRNSNQWNSAYAHSQSIGNPHNTQFAELLNKPSTLDGYGITDGAKIDGSNATGVWPISVNGSAKEWAGNVYSGYIPDAPDAFMVLKNNQWGYGSQLGARQYLGTDVNPSANSIVQRDGNGYVSGVYLRSTNMDILSYADGIDYMFGGRADGYLYKYTKQAVNLFLGSPENGDTLQSVTDRGSFTTKTIRIQAGSSGFPTLTNYIDGVIQFYGDNELYGSRIGVDTSSGNTWWQAQRYDSAQAYSLILQPAGGAVGVGTTAPKAGSLLDVNGKITCPVIESQYIIPTAPPSTMEPGKWYLTVRTT